LYRPPSTTTQLYSQLCSHLVNRYVGASAGVRGSGKNVNSKVKPRPTKPAVDYSNIYDDIDLTMRNRKMKNGRYQGTGNRPGWVDENGKVDEVLFNADKQKRADAADIYNKRRKSANSYQGLHVYRYIHISLYIDIYIYICAYIYVCIHTYIHTYIYRYIYTSIYVYIYIRHVFTCYLILFCTYAVLAGPYVLYYRFLHSSFVIYTNIS
jgi:hypothetical protein